MDIALEKGADVQIALSERNLPKKELNMLCRLKKPRIMHHDFVTDWNIMQFYNATMKNNMAT